jgi:putative transposase
LKYECVYLHAFETGSELRAGLATWVSHYNGYRPHSKLDGKTPDEICFAHPPPPLGGPACRAVAADVPLAA